MDKTLNHLSKFLGIKADILKNAIEKDNPEDLKFEGLQVLKDSDLQTIKDNSHRDGIEKGKENFVSDVQKAAGLEGTFKDVKSIIKTVKENTLKEAKIEPNKRISELEGQLQTAQNTITDKDRIIAEKDNSISSVKRDYKIASKLPKEIGNGLTREDGVMLLTSGLKTVTENGNDYPLGVDGKKMQDSKGNFITLDSYIDTKIQERGWVESGGGNPDTGGKGGNHRNGNGQQLNSVKDLMSMEDIGTYAELKGIKKSAEINKLISEASQNEGFKMD